MSWYYNDYESKADAAARVERLIAKRRKAGEALTPVLPAGKSRELSTTFWGQAWNRNLMAYSDYESRMPRGRSYFRGGKVLDLALSPGKISSVVAGSDLYAVTISIQPLPAPKWEELKQRCRGGIGSLVELLAGRFSSEIMKEVTDLERGLFPSPKEIRFNCSCPDWADLCKHCAATLYAVGTKLDSDPGLFFTLRQLDAEELTGGAAAAVEELTAPAAQVSERSAAIQDTDLSALFGVDLGGLDELAALAPPEEKPKAAPKTKPSPKKKPAAKAAKKAPKPGKKK